MQTTCLVFLLSGQRYAIKLSYVEKVILFTKMHTVPGLPPFFKGVLNVHGQNRPIIDLRERLQLPSTTEYTINTPIILSENTDQAIGLIVDDIVGIEEGILNPLKIQKSHDNEVAALNQGIIQNAQGDAILIDITKLCTEAVVLE